jgi:dGTPase
MTTEHTAKERQAIKPIIPANEGLEKINKDQHKLAPYACDPNNSIGRLIEEPLSITRSEFRRDCDRIIHSASFRRLEYKTQVFVNHEGDHYRTRLTHTLEVAQIARVIARSLSLSEDLVEALALAHDLGHTPFGHAGEDGLNHAADGLCRFEHNIQSVRIITELESRYAAFDGLNLSWEVIEGVIKHNGPVTGKNRDKGHYNGKVLGVVADLNNKKNLLLDKFPTAEAQVAALADDIAYNNHDLDDGLRAGLFTIDDVCELPMIGNMFRELKNEFPDVDNSRLVHEANRRLIGRMIIDLTRQTLKNIESHSVQSVDDIRNMNEPLVNFSKGMRQNMAMLQEFLKANMYHHYKVCRMTKKAQRIVSELYDTFFNSPECLPDDWRRKAIDTDKKTRARVAMDYIAGMTDRYAIEEHKRLFEFEKND